VNHLGEFWGQSRSVKKEQKLTRHGKVRQLLVSDRQ
jgi:hypothetical protein